MRATQQQQKTKINEGKCIWFLGIVHNYAQKSGRGTGVYVYFKLPHLKVSIHYFNFLFLQFKTVANPYLKVLLKADLLATNATQQICKNQILKSGI